LRSTILSLPANRPVRDTCALDASPCDQAEAVVASFSEVLRLGHRWICLKQRRAACPRLLLIVGIGIVGIILRLRVGRGRSCQDWPNILPYSATPSASAVTKYSFSWHFSFSWLDVSVSPTSTAPEGARSRDKTAVKTSALFGNVGAVGLKIPSSHRISARLTKTGPSDHWMIG